MLRRMALALPGAACLAGCFEEPNFADRYPGPWQNPDQFVAETMAKKSDRFYQLCKDAYMRPAFNKPGARAEYLIYCTFDKSEWFSFVIFTGMDEVIGPNNIYPEIPPPN